MTDIPPDRVLPCGCILRSAVISQVNTTTIIPCRRDCTNYRTFLTLAETAGLPVEYRSAP